MADSVVSPPIRCAMIFFQVLQFTDKKRRDFVLVCQDPYGFNTPKGRHLKRKRKAWHITRFMETARSAMLFLQFLPVTDKNNATSFLCVYALNV